MTKELNFAQLFNRLNDSERYCMERALVNYHNIIRNPDFNRESVNDIKIILMASIDLIKSEV